MLVSHGGTTGLLFVFVTDLKSIAAFLNPILFVV